MCSIAGSTDWFKVEKMLQTMKHRSPDGERQSADGNYVIGMGRLAIIDRENDEYPMVRDNLTLTFNGEIYNYRELRQELKLLGVEFTTQGDTEVLIRAYQQWGVACLDKLNGMFAFAIYDASKRQLFFARDIAGEKPLYYLHLPGSFEFASEAKALGFACAELPQASYGIYNFHDDTLHIEQWWKFVPREINLETAIEELSFLIQDSVRLRTRADVPYGLYLSGGVDSSLLSTFHPFEHTFTYTDGDYRDEFIETFPKILWHLDYPIDSFSPFGLWKLAEQAKSTGVKVVLSGEGADELFGGYIRYVPNALNLKAQDEFPSYKGLFPVESDLGYVDFFGKMQTLLRMGDRMASAHGIENRCPFLDRRIIEFAFSLPATFKAYGYDTKIILRKLLKSRWASYQESEKHGLYCSVNEWLGEPNRLSKGTYLSYQENIWKKYQQ